MNRLTIGIGALLALILTCLVKAVYGVPVTGTGSITVPAPVGITMVGTATSAFSGGGNLVLPLPGAGTTPTAPTIMIVGCSQTLSPAPGFVIPTGYTPIPNTTDVFGQGSIAGFYTVYGAGTPIPASIGPRTTDGLNKNYGCSAVAYTGQAVGPLWDNSGNADTTLSSGIPFPNFTTTVNGDQLVYFATDGPGTGNITISTTPTSANRTHILSTTSGGVLQQALNDVNMATAGFLSGTDGATWTTPGYGASWLAALIPAPGNAPTPFSIPPPAVSNYNPAIYTAIYAGKNYVWSMFSDGTGVTQLSSGVNTDNGPVEWSWDGKKIIWATAGGQIWTANADGSGAAALPNTSHGSDQDPTFMPSGQIVFTVITRQPSGTTISPISELHMANGDGSGEAVLFNGSNSTTTPAQCFFHAAHSNPTGTLLVFQSYYPALNQFFPFSLYTCNPASFSTCYSSFTKLGPTAVQNPGTPPTGTTYADPKFSRDGSKVAFSYLDLAGNLNVAYFIVSQGASALPVYVTNYSCSTGDRAQDAGWSFDGSSIIFEYSHNPSACGNDSNTVPTNIYVTTTGGSNATPSAVTNIVTSTGVQCANVGCSPRFSPAAINGGHPAGRNSWIVRGPSPRTPKNVKMVRLND